MTDPTSSAPRKMPPTDLAGNPLPIPADKLDAPLPPLETRPDTVINPIIEAAETVLFAELAQYPPTGYPARDWIEDQDSIYYVEPELRGVYVRCADAGRGSAGEFSRIKEPTLMFPNEDGVMEARDATYEQWGHVERLNEANRMLAGTRAAEARHRAEHRVCEVCGTEGSIVRTGANLNLPPSMELVTVGQVQVWSCVTDAPLLREALIRRDLVHGRPRRDVVAETADRLIPSPDGYPAPDRSWDIV